MDFDQFISDWEQQFITGNATGILGIKPLGLPVSIGNIIAITITIIVFTIIGKVVSRIIRRKLSENVEAKNTDFLVRLSVWIVAFIGFLVVLPQLHLDLSGLMVAGGAFAFAASFASQNALSNLVAGVLLMIEHPISMGDAVIIGGTEGYVEKISLISTLVRTYDGLILRIPNTSVFSSQLTNCLANVARRFLLNIDIGYSEDANKAISLLRETLYKNPYVLVDPQPTLYVDELGDSSIKIVAKIWTPSKYWLTVKYDVLWMMFVALRDAGIEIPFNQIVLWYGDENAKKLNENIDSGKSASEILQNAKRLRENIDSESSSLEDFPPKNVKVINEKA